MFGPKQPNKWPGDITVFYSIFLLHVTLSLQKYKSFCLTEPIEWKLHTFPSLSPFKLQQPISGENTKSDMRQLKRLADGSIGCMSQQFPQKMEAIDAFNKSMVSGLKKLTKLP